MRRGGEDRGRCRRRDGEEKETERWFTIRIHQQYTCVRCTPLDQGGSKKKGSRKTEGGQKERGEREKGRKTRGGEYLGLICSLCIFQSCFDDLFQVPGKISFYLVLLQLLQEKKNGLVTSSEFLYLLPPLSFLISVPPSPLSFFISFSRSCLSLPHSSAHYLFDYRF